MKNAEFRKLLREHFQPQADEHGFNNEGGRDRVYYRQASSDVWHVIFFEQGTRGHWCDIKVIATSPVIDVKFARNFPREFAFVNAPDCYLSEYPEMNYQQRYPCSNAAAFILTLEKKIIPAFRRNAIPYLNKLKRIEDIIPTLRRDIWLGPALLHVGKVQEGRVIIQREITRLSALKSDKQGMIDEAISHLSDLLEMT